MTRQVTLYTTEKQLGNDSYGHFTSNNFLGELG